MHISRRLLLRGAAAGGAVASGVLLTGAGRPGPAPSVSLDPLRDVVRRATVVGLGESTHGSHEQFVHKTRVVRYLVERLGFRTVAFEHDFAHGVDVDRYVTTGAGDPEQIVRAMGFPFWVCQEIVDLVRWMRGYNETHRDRVRFLGADITTLRQASFDAVTSYVRDVAPGRLPDLNRLLDPLRPRPYQIQWYRDELSQAQRTELIESARAAVRLVRTVPRTAPKLTREYAEQHARTIVGWCEHYNRPGFSEERELFMADTVRWWQNSVAGGNVVLWAANFHTTSADTVTYTHPYGSWTGRTAGGYLKRSLGHRYAAVASVFGQGTISSDYSDVRPHPVAAPPAGLLDHDLGRSPLAEFLVPVRAPELGALGIDVRARATARMILPSYSEDNDGSGYVMTVPSLAAAFDALLYVRTTTASRLLT